MFNLIEKIGTTVLVAVPVVAIVLTVMIMKKRMRPSVVRINNIFEVCGFISCHIYILYIILYFQKNIDLSYFLLVTYFISICLISVLLLYSRLIQTLILTSVAFFLFFAVFTITVDAKKKTQDVNWQINDVTFEIPDSAATNISLWINGHKCGLFEQDFQSLTLTLPLEKIVSLPKAKASEDIFSAIDNGKYGMKISLPQKYFDAPVECDGPLKLNKSQNYYIYLMVGDKTVEQKLTADNGFNFTADLALIFDNKIKKSRIKTASIKIDFQDELITPSTVELIREAIDYAIINDLSINVFPTEFVKDLNLFKIACQPNVHRRNRDSYLDVRRERFEWISNHYYGQQERTSKEVVKLIGQFSRDISGFYSSGNSLVSTAMIDDLFKPYLDQLDYQRLLSDVLLANGKEDYGISFSVFKNAVSVRDDWKFNSAIIKIRLLALICQTTQNKAVLDEVADKLINNLNEITMGLGVQSWFDNCFTQYALKRYEETNLPWVSSYTATKKLADHFYEFCHFNKWYLTIMRSNSDLAQEFQKNEILNLVQLFGKELKSPYPMSYSAMMIFKNGITEEYVKNWPLIKKVIIENEKPEDQFKTMIGVLKKMKNYVTPEICYETFVSEYYRIGDDLRDESFNIGNSSKNLELYSMLHEFMKDKQVEDETSELYETKRKIRARLSMYKRRKRDEEKYAKINKVHQLSFFPTQENLKKLEEFCQSDDEDLKAFAIKEFTRLQKIKKKSINNFPLLKER